ncbi:hypothetical protein Patl1_00191 [Pistacia atlantica]|uniref:Uncharacterized protein n=1 Tax=Pistacia atlantica TaxID=434234 RepID=A0ACC1C676_9ROSI|nr:hypothetical protein Patl1_00191 [Pistacia atlantica]
MDMRKIKSHFSGVRGTDIEICLKVPEAIQFAVLEAMGAPNKKAKSPTSTSTSLNDIAGEAETISTSALNKKAKTLHQPAVCDKDKSTAADILVAKFLISNNLPLDVSKTPFLADLVKSIAEFGPTYELPDYLALNSQLKPHVEEETEEYVGNVEIFQENSIYRIIESLGAENVVQCIIDDSEGWMVDSRIDFEVLKMEKEIKALELRNDENVVAESDDVYKAIHSTEFWSNGKTVLQVLQPIFQVLELVDCNVSTSGYLYDAMKKVENAFKQHCEGDEGISAEFKVGRNRIITPMHAAAAFLNPASMWSQNFTEGDEIQKVPELFIATAVEMLNKLHPRKWWECFGDRYPILQKYAIRILSQTCSASLCYPCDFQPNDLVDEFQHEHDYDGKFQAVEIKERFGADCS